MSEEESWVDGDEDDPSWEVDGDEDAWLARVSGSDPHYALADLSDLGVDQVVALASALEMNTTVTALDVSFSVVTDRGAKVFVACEMLRPLT
jgi:hypothetical protein